MNDRKLVIDTAKKCLFEPGSEEKCENCPYFQYSTETDDCWFHLVADLIYLLDGGTPKIVDQDRDEYWLWDYNEHTWKKITKEEFDKNREDEEAWRKKWGEKGND